MKSVAIIGGGFTGLSAAYYLSKKGIKTYVIEKDAEVGGLAGSFKLNGVELEKFYHHWFTNDRYVMDIIKELGKEDEIIIRESRTGLYYANNFYKLSTPLDLLNFKALSFFNRIRLGFMVLAVRYINNWKKLENITAYEWIKNLAGNQVFKVLWKPLLDGKFGEVAPQVSAVWFWNKLKLRGSSRGSKGNEELAYYKGGFARLAGHLVREIEKNGGEIYTDEKVISIDTLGKIVTSITTDKRKIVANKYLSTIPLPVFANMISNIESVPLEYVNNLKEIPFLANVCLVLDLDRSLSNTYWLNVSDPDFPFVGIIEHTNFEKPESYHGSHIVYLSKYLPETSEMFKMDDNELLNFSIPYIQKMFPEFGRDWIKNSYVWRAKYSQPVVIKNYSKLIPPFETPLENLYLSTMAQIYPEDRGTNYAIREGKYAAESIFSYN